MRRGRGWRALALLGVAAVSGCAPKAFVRHEVHSEMRKQKETVESLREDVAQDAARSAAGVADLERSLVRLTGELQAVRGELAAVRQLMVMERLETQAEIDRVRTDVARLSATVQAACDRAAALDASVRRTLEAQRNALDSAVESLSKPDSAGP